MLHMYPPHLKKLSQQITFNVSQTSKWCRASLFLCAILLILNLRPSLSYFDPRDSFFPVLPHFPRKTFEIHKKELNNLTMVNIVLMSSYDESKFAGSLSIVSSIISQTKSQRTLERIHLWVIVNSEHVKRMESKLNCVLNAEEKALNARFLRKASPAKKSPPPLPETLEKN